MPRFDPVETLPGDAARLTRMQWRMPVGPVYDLIGWIEASGCVVIEEDFDTARVDGLSQWVGDHPVILMNISSPTDRKRLTLAHELGHLCLHSVEVTEHMEAEANAFAAEFLMPAEVIRSQLRNLSIGRLYDLKREWGVSMQAIIERAYSLKVMTATQRTSLYKRFSSMGWRTREPISEELPQEQARLARHIGSVLSEKGLTAGEIARIAGYIETDQVPPLPAGRPAPPGCLTPRAGSASAVPLRPPARREPVQVQQRQHLGDLRRPAARCRRRPRTPARGWSITRRIRHHRSRTPGPVQSGP